MPRKKMHVNLKADLIKAMRTVLKVHALDGLDVRKIVKEAGCSIGTFYNNFKSLDDLVISFNGETIDILTARLFESYNPQESAKETIRRLCLNYIAFAEENHTEWLLLLEYPIKVQPPSWYQDKVDHLFQKVCAIFHPILKGPKTDTEKAVKILWSGLHGICSLTLKQKLRFTKEQNTLELCQELFHNYILGYRIGLGIT